MKTFIAICAAVSACWVTPAARGQEVYYFATLSGGAFQPPIASPGSGAALVYVDLALSLLHVDVTFSGLDGGVTAAHVHGLTVTPGAGLADPATSLPTLPGFASGVTSGIYHGIVDLTHESTYNPAFITEHGGSTAQAKVALLNGLAAGQTYFSIATSSHGSGEIRGFLAPDPAADFDHNGRVDGPDLNLWRLGFGESDFGDADDDGDTDGADYLQWQRQFGLTAELPHHHHAEVAGAAIPEPATFGAAAMSLATIAALLRRR